MNILNQPIHPAAAKEIGGGVQLVPASVRFDGTTTAPAGRSPRWQAQTLRRASSYVASSPPMHALRVVVSSAVALDARQTELIARKMRRITGFVNLAIENVVDPSLIAGFVVCYGLGDSHAIDLSVKGRLAALKSRVDSFDRDATAMS